MNSSSKSKLITKLVIALFVLLTAFWVYMTVAHQSSGYRLTFGATYGLMALVGAVYGFSQARHWGGHKSALGQTILLLAAGLAFAEFGQLVFSYYNIVKQVDIPYPSLADIGFFGNIPLYILAGISLGRTAGARLSLRKAGVKLVAFVIPAISLFSAYYFFLQDYDFSQSTGLQTFLNFGYPLGQATYVAIALFVFLAVNGKLGGLMRTRILMVIAAFVTQFAADFNFLYQSSHGTWINGGYGDMLYLIAYFVMTISLIRLCAPITVQAKKEGA